MRKTKKRKINLFLKIILIMIFFGFFSFMGFMYYIYLCAPEFNADLLYKKESSNIYDISGKLIATIGSEKREIVEYDDLPEVLIDAIIATEDNRFFQHKGLDLVRFANASFSYLQGKDAGGASTLTMQVSKNSLTSTESEGFEGIIRKFTDIYLSLFKIEKDYNKKEIIEFYVNSPYMGGGAYGVQVASNIYFGKDVKDINLVEAAMLAGLFQAPGEYDPYVNPDKTNNRKNTVLDLMHKYGYISKEEAEAAKKIDVEDIIVKNNESINPYQGFIDTVVQEVIDRTGNNPYVVSQKDLNSQLNKVESELANKTKAMQFVDTQPNQYQATLAKIEKIKQLETEIKQTSGANLEKLIQQAETERQSVLIKLRELYAAQGALPSTETLNEMFPQMSNAEIKAWDAWFAGTIDELAVYSAPLTAGQVKKLYNAQK